MRILIHDFAGHPFQIQLSRELARRDHTVVHTYPVGLQGPKGPLHHFDDDVAGFTICGIALSKAFRKYSALSRLKCHRRYARDLCRVITQRGPEVVLSCNTPIDVQAELLWHCRRNGIAFVHWVQDVYSKAMEFYLRRKCPPLAAAGSLLFRKLECAVTDRSDAVVVIAPAFRQLLAAWGIPVSKITVIENWAPLSDITARARRNSWSEEHGLNDRTVLLYTGTLGMKHRPDLLYSLAEELDERSVVVVISEGVGREYLERLPRRGNLVLLPFQPYERVPEILASADVLVATLEAEAGDFAVPSKLLSYLCAGRPVLIAAPERNRASEIIRNAGAGIAVDPDRLDQWKQAARRLALDPAFRAEAGENGARYAQNNFRIATIANSFEAVLHRAVRSDLTQPGGEPLVSEA